jgi:hypothetical protein
MVRVRVMLNNCMVRVRVSWNVWLVLCETNVWLGLGFREMNAWLGLCEMNVWLGLWLCGMYG